MISTSIADLFPKIISGRIGDVVRPGSEWRQRRQSVGLLDETAHLSGAMQDQAQSDQPKVADANVNPARRSTGLERLSALPLHPFLFAAASVFRLYASNLHQVYFSDVAIALAAALGAALVLFLAFGAALRNFGAKAAILASAALVAGLFYSEIIDAANRYAGTGLSPVAALPIILAIPWGSPQRIGKAHVADQLADLKRHRRSSPARP